MKCTGAAAVPLALLAPMLAPASWQAAAALQRGALAAEPWRLWTGHLVHFSLAHALVDAAALGTLLALRPAVLRGRALLFGALAAAPLLSGAILCLEPALRVYRGASGLVVGLAVWIGWAAWHERSLPRGALLALGLAGGAKLLGDALGPHASPVLPAGVAVAWSAHVGGALLGAVCGLAWARAQRTAA